MGREYPAHGCGYYLRTAGRKICRGSSDLTGAEDDTSSDAGERLLTLHASAVRIEDHGILITGASGDGKSTLALNLMALGADLVADDYCRLRRADDVVWLEKPDTLPPAIELRGMGLLRAPIAPRARLSVVIDLSEPETERLPPTHFCDFLGLTFRKFKRVEGSHFPYGILHYLRHGSMA
ncbi:MAG: serine kinase [Paracoccaceae bacterium]